MSEQFKALPTATPDPGANTVGRAYRAELMNENQPIAAVTADAHGVNSPKPSSPAHRSDARAAQRKRVNGRARVLRNGMQPVAGKMVDISQTGACVILDELPPSKVACVLEFDIFHDGKRYAFSAPAETIYGIYSSGKGFKVGFQFGPCGPQATQCVNALVA